MLTQIADLVRADGGTELLGGRGAQLRLPLPPGRPAISGSGKSVISIG
ncbi:hypothetical protein PV703_09120 [Streptomyces sp. ME01-24h]|nr:hypothetical protein [Streptomyces sp. ME19-03-3]MDX3353478.1 hypothetical protein [Streptomyces sp. ME01-24h]